MGDQGAIQRCSSDQVSIQYVHKPGCVVEVTVSIPPKACLVARHKAIKDVRKDVSIPGFRRGHVPEELLMTHFGPQIERITKEHIVNLACREGLRLVQRAPFSKSSFQKVKWNSYPAENGAEIFFQYEAAPEVPSIVIDELALEPVMPKSPSEEEVEDCLLQARYLFSEKTPVTDRPAAEGDLVKISVPAKEGQKEASSELYIHPRLAPEWLVQGLIGMNIGETRELSPITDSLQAKDSKVVPGKITLRSVSQTTPITNDEELVKFFGEITPENLRKRILSHLEYEAKVAAHDRMRRQVRNELIRLYAFDLPQSLVEGETESRFQFYWNGIKDNDLLPNKDTVRRAFLDEVKRQYTCFFLLQPMFEQLNPSYSEAELFHELQAQMSSVPPFQRVLRADLEQHELINRLLVNIIIRKCEDYFIQQRLGISAPEYIVKPLFGSNDLTERVEECSKTLAHHEDPGICEEKTAEATPENESPKGSGDMPPPCEPM